MDKYKRNASSVLAVLSEAASGQIIVKKDCIVHMPVRFPDVGLGEIGIDTYCYGLFPIILKETNEYAVMNCCSIINLNPSKTAKVIIEDEEYYEFHFNAGQAIIKSNAVVRRDDVIYNILDEVVFKGKVPWYVEYDDLGKIFDTAKEYANSNVGQVIETVEFIASMIGRDRKDRRKYIRTTLKSYSELTKANVEFIPMKSIFYAVNSTMNKLTGSYFSDGVTSALVTKTEKVEKIESILRA